MAWVSACSKTINEPWGGSYTNNDHSLRYIVSSRGSAGNASVG